jgi:hypothetical protein
METDSAKERILAALLVLSQDHWVISSVPGMITATRQWSDGSQDTVLVLSPEIAYARRDDPSGRLVWHRKGPVGEVVAAAQYLNPPAP